MTVLQSSSATFTRFYVVGNRTPEYRQRYLEGIRENAFWEIDQTDVEESFGWVSWDDFTDYEFSEDTYTRDEYIVLCLRIDKRRIPKSTLKLHYRQAEKNMIRETGQKHLSKNQRKDLLDHVEKTLLGRVPAVPEVYDLVWNIVENVVYIGTTSQLILDRFIDLFNTTFQLELKLAFPYSVAEQFYKSDTDRLKLEELKPAHFAVFESETGANPDASSEVPAHREQNELIESERNEEESDE